MTWDKRTVTLSGPAVPAFLRTINEQGANTSSQASDGMGGCVAPYTHAFLWENGGSSVDLNQVTLPSSTLYLTAASFISEKGEIIAGGDPIGCTDNYACNHVALLIPCDENHPNVEGCDYSLVESSADAGASPTAERTPVLEKATVTSSGAVTPFLRAVHKPRRAGTLLLQ